MTILAFEKYEAAGNDFIMIDARHDESLLDICRKLAPKACHRHFGIGADGILVITRTLGNIPADAVDAAMHVINSDGSIAAMCGNGIRCAARFLTEKCNFTAPDIIRFATLGGIQRVRQLTQSAYEVDMAKVCLGRQISIPQGSKTWLGTFVDVGNPHTVFEIEDSPTDALNAAGEFLSNHPTYADRCNIEFIRKRGENSIDLTVFERGAGPTLACGTGCAAAASVYARNHDIVGETIEIHAPGGILHVVTSADASIPVKLRGPANYVFSGTLEY